MRLATEHFNGVLWPRNSCKTASRAVPFFALQLPDDDCLESTFNTQLLDTLLESSYLISFFQILQAILHFQYTFIGYLSRKLLFSFF